MNKFEEKPADSVKQWFVNMFIATDQWFNTLFGGAPDETISSRIDKNKETCMLCRWMCDILNKIDPNHCQKYREDDEG